MNRRSTKYTARTALKEAVILGLALLFPIYILLQIISLVVQFRGMDTNIRQGLIVGIIAGTVSGIVTLLVPLFTAAYFTGKRVRYLTHLDDLPNKQQFIYIVVFTPVILVFVFIAVGLLLEMTIVKS